MKDTERGKQDEGGRKFSAFHPPSPGCCICSRTELDLLFFPPVPAPSFLVILFLCSILHTCISISSREGRKELVGGGKERTCWSWRREEGVKCVLSSRHRSCSVVSSVFTSTCSLSFGRKVLVLERERERESNFFPQNLLILPPPPSPNLVLVKRM